MVNIKNKNVIKVKVKKGFIERSTTTKNQCKTVFTRLVTLKLTTYVNVEIRVIVAFHFIL